MAKNLPYFKFIATEWLTGDIVFESFEAQGLFINICALYWQRDGKLYLSDLEKRFGKATAYHSLIGRFIYESEGLITIPFLDEQLEERTQRSEQNSINGKLGALKKSEIKRTLSKRSATESNKDKEEDKEINKEIYRKFDHLKITLDEFNILNKTYSKEQIDNVLDSIQNYRANKKYVSLFLTASKWLSKENKSNEIKMVY